MNGPLTIQDVPMLTPTGRQLLVRVKAAALCHSDLSIISGAMGLSFFPLNVGHEAVSVVEKLGPDTESFTDLSVFNRINGAKVPGKART